MHHFLHHPTFEWKYTVWLDMRNIYLFFPTTILMRHRGLVLCEREYTENKSDSVMMCRIAKVE